ncbi:MAG TPA: two-component regulator propeller domain-containing protein [Exilispira sp.]|nr:two-component regulator propeller domain-containing protein [Exilispira sp.]
MKIKTYGEFYKIFILLILVLSLFSYSFSNDNKKIENIYFDIIDAKMGLSNSSVSSIVQDSKGFLWFSTQNGLNRFDGKSFLIFNKKPFEKNSIPNQLIQTMYMDKDDILWLGTYGGLCKFDIKKNKFTTYKNIVDDKNSLSNDVVIAIERDKEGKLWVGTLKGLQIFDEKKEKFERVFFDRKEDGPTNESTIRDIYADSLGNVWIGTYDGIYKYFDGKFSFYTNNKVFKLEENLFSKDNFNKTIIKSFEASYPAANPSMVIIEDKDKNLWFGIWGFGLVKYDIVKKIFINYPLPFNKIYSLLFIDNDNLLVGTWGEGLFNFNKKDNSFMVVENKKFGLSIPNNTIYSLFKDKSGIIWIGTHGSGVLKWVPNRPDFVYLKYDEKNPNSIPNSKVMSIFEDHYGYIWLGTYNNGLIRYNPKNKEIIKYLSSGKEDGSLSNNIVRSIYQDSYGNLWIATNQHLNLYNYKTGKFKYFKKTDFGLQPTNEDTFTYITEDKNKNLIIGTYLSGIIILPLSSDKEKILDFSKVKLINSKTSPSLSNDLVFKIFIDDKERIWIGTNKGLNLLDTKNWEINKFYYEIENPEGLSDDAITDIFQDSNKRIWVCTTNGLNLYDDKSGKFSHITIENGFKDNYINSIEELDDGIMILTTFGNLVKYNFYTSEIINFGYEDGLFTKEFSSGIYKLKDGSILIGAVGVVNIVSSQELKANDFNPNIQIVSISIEGKDLEESKLYYDDNIKLRLPYNKNSISIRFTSLDYSAPNTLLYSYKIDKFNKDWQYLGNEGVLNLVNLKQGNYKIYLRGTNSSGIYSKNIKILTITIDPPFYLTWWAILIYLFIIVSILFLTLLFLREKALSQILIERKNLIEERKIFLEEEIKKQKEIEKNLIEAKESLENLNQAKDFFISQISHEFKNPLTLLLGYIQILDNNEKDSFKKEAIKNMNSIANHILDMVITVLDMAKINLGKVKIELSEVDFYNFINVIADSHSILAEQKGLNFEFQYAKDLPKSVMIDKVKVRQILNNLLSNAIKYTDQGYIRFNVLWRKPEDIRENVEENEKFKKIDLIFEIIDSGIGLTKQEIEKIFDSFYRGVDSLKVDGTGLGLSISKKLAELMNGQILVESEKGVGSKFSLILKDIAATK